MSWNKVFENPVAGRDLVVTSDRMGMGRLLKVRGPAYRMVQLPEGARTKFGDLITKHTSDWARIGYEKVADEVTLERPRQSGHEIEGRVRIRGKSYSAFTSGGENPDGGDGMIIVRMR